MKSQAMHKFVTVIALFLVTLFLDSAFCGAADSTATPSPPTATPKLKWETSLTENVNALALSPDGRYLAITTLKGVALLETSGKLLWEKDYSIISRWMSYGSAAFVVAPKGQWVAVAGNSSYRYVWVLDKQERKQWYVKTTGTPQALAVTHKGDLLAIGTAAGHIYLMSPHGRTLADTVFEGGGVISGLTFSEDDAYLLTTEGIGSLGLLSREGKIVLNLGGTRLSMSRNLRWFVLADTPMHGTSLGILSLFSRTGENLWLKALHEIYLGALISPDGSYIVASGIWPKSLDETSPAEGAEPRIIILDRQGNVLLEKEGRGSPFFISQDSHYFIVKQGYEREWVGTPLYDWVCYERNGGILWRLDGETMACTPDLSLVIVSDGKMVRAYTPPGKQDQ